jgi:isopentenyldiphosphate isomerase
VAADDLVDVVDADDRVIGGATRRQVRADNLLHRACYVVVLDADGRVFVHLRTATKDVFPSHYDAVVGGVLAAGESYDEGARREVREEIGVDAEQLRQVGFLRYEDRSSRVHGEIFECRATPPLSLQADEVVSGEWLEAGEVERRIDRAPFCPDGVLAFRVWSSRRGDDQC